MKTAYDIIIRPILTEKSYSEMADGKYTFQVDKRANKSEIRKAVEKAFDGVKVDTVNTMNIKGKPKRMGRSQGYTSDWKKAIVTLAKDSKKIPFFEGMEQED